MSKHKGRIVGGALSLAAVAAVAASGSGTTVTKAADREQSTQLISRAMDGSVPNGPSTHAVISNDKRYARAIAFESEASDLVAGDTNGLKDVFAVLRGGHIDNYGAKWEAGRTVMLSRGRGGQPANGVSYSPSISGGFHNRPTCVAFLSAASNLVAGDMNGTVDAFVTSVKGGKMRRVKLPGGVQADTTAVAISGNCKQVAYVRGGRLYVSKKGRKAHRVGPANAADPSYSTGLNSDLVFGASRGVYLARGGTKRPRLIARGGRNPAYNDIKRQVVTYEKMVHGRSQIAYKDLGHRERIISSRKGARGNGGSRNPVIGNAGYYVTFESDASNLGVNSLNRVDDHNGLPDAYLFTDVRDLTLVQSVVEKAVPMAGGGQNPSMSFYANYIVFDSPAPSDHAGAPHQVFMRYLGPV